MRSAFGSHADLYWYICGACFFRMRFLWGLRQVTKAQENIAFFPSERGSPQQRESWQSLALAYLAFIRGLGLGSGGQLLRLI